MAYVLINAALLCIMSFECFRRLQGANYRPSRGYFNVLLSPYFLSLVMLQAAVLTAYYYKAPQYVISILYGAAAIVFAVIPHKSPLKFTKRILRMLVVCLAVTFTLSYFGVEIYCIAALPLVTLIPFVICLPIDCLIARHYIRKAVKKLEQSNVTVVAVTGSYGKTSVKDMLTALLDDSVCPQGSCNTPLGIAAFINKTDLYYVKYLVLEFGARKRGDIAELCKLYRPKYGIITGVCPQHLSTFKTWDNVVAAKRELAENLPKNGVCVLNCECDTAMSYVNSGECAKVASKSCFTVKTEGVTVKGTTLSVTYRKTAKQARLPQITAHAADTFAMCLTMCLTLKQSFTKTMDRVVNIKQTPHRMEISEAANCCIIDDGYNGSIKGVESAAATLANFAQFKTVITQGLVECGRKKRELNVKCGEILGSACNVAIVTGINKKYLAEGLNKTDCKVIYAKKLKQAVELAQPYLNGADSSILLFQNDIP